MYLCGRVVAVVVLVFILVSFAISMKSNDFTHPLIQNMRYFTVVSVLSTLSLLNGQPNKFIFSNIFL